MTRAEAIRRATEEYKLYALNPGPLVKEAMRGMTIQEIGLHVARAINIRADQIMREHEK
jgi:hypothetical protein